MKLKTFTKEAYGKKREMIYDPILLKAYTVLTGRSTLNDEKKKAFKEFGVEFEPMN